METQESRQKVVFKLNESPCDAWMCCIIMRCIDNRHYKERNATEYNLALKSA